MDLEIRQHNQTVLYSLEEGDLVEFPRGLYSHWGVYVGGDEVVHLTGDPNAGSSVNANPSHVFAICGVEFSKAKVKREKFFDVAAGSKAKKNNDKDNKIEPSDKQTIVQRALSQLGDIGYNILWKNCEYFASSCRYGKGWSEQTITALGYAAKYGALAAFVLQESLSACGGIYWWWALYIGRAALYNIFSSKKKKN